MKHVLFDHLVRFSRNKLANPEGYYYHLTDGMWISENDAQEALVKSTIPGKPIRGTKKHDVETGEDIKGQ